VASSDRLTRLKNIRDNLEAELENETARRLALTAAGHPPPATYTVAGKQVDWNGYLSLMLARIKEANDAVLAAGGDGGLYEERVRAYT
jgi:hypothetical protein